MSLEEGKVQKLNEDDIILADQQDLISRAHQRLQEWRTKKGGGPAEEVHRNDGSETFADQDRQLQDFEDINLEIKHNSSQVTESGGGDNEKQSDSNRKGSVRGQRNSMSDHYKQFYGGIEDDVIIREGVQKNSASKKNELELGAFQGVYLPCVTNILSVIIFMRINYIVGEAGIFQAFMILFFSTSTTFLTVLSMSAIATNGKIRTGGVYYMISRSLGPSTGGSIGILYYLATTFSSAMSILGAIEAIHIAASFSLGPLSFSMRFFSFFMLAILVIVNLFGAKFVNRAGNILIFLVFISIISMIIGLFSSKRRSDELMERVPGLTGIDNQNFIDNWGSHYQADSFYTLHAIFFNACTGILTGANSSVNLKDPISAIPKGTIWAHLSTLALYIVLFLLFGCAGTHEALTNLNVIVGAEIAWPQRWIVYIGIILSSSGSALQQIQNAPYLINAIADDDMLPKIFNFLKGDVRKSLYFTAGLIAISICFGSIDQVAPLVTIFYLLCYGGVNIACFLLDLLGSPNWRPKWKYYHKTTAFVGVILCVASMIVISWWASLSSIVGSLMIYAYLDKKSQEKNWGDGVEGIRAERARNALLKIDKFKKHVKNWRPHYLALGYINEKGKISSPGIFKLLHQLRKGTGLAIYGCVIKGDYTAKAYEDARKKENDLDAFMKKNKYNVFSKVVVSQNIENGMVYLIQSSGLGGLEPNTILLSWPSQWENDELKSNRFVNMIKHAHTFGHLLTILKPQKEFDNDIKHTGTIDIWSFNFEKGMLLLIAQILIKNTHWKRCKVRLFIITSLPLAETETMKRVAREYLSKYRLLQEQGTIFIEVVHVSPSMIDQFTYNLNATLRKKEKVFQDAIQGNNKDFEYGTLPSLMKVKALQEKEIQSALENRMKKSNQSNDVNVETQPDQDDIDEKIESARQLNEIIMKRSQDASLVITNLPPILAGQNAQDYLRFCSIMTENITRLLFIQNSSKEVLTQYS